MNNGDQPVGTNTGKDGSKAQRALEQKKADLNSTNKKAMLKVDESSVEKISKEIEEENKKTEQSSKKVKVDSNFEYKETDLKKEEDDISEENKKTLTDDEREIVDEFKRELRRISRSQEK